MMDEPVAAGATQETMVNADTAAQAVADLHKHVAQCAICKAKE
jgi:hypothetical protein